MLNCQFFLLATLFALAACRTLTAGASASTSSLNEAISAALGASNKDGDLERIFKKYFGEPVVPVEEDCGIEYPHPKLIEPDSDLIRVLRSQKVRVGIAPAATTEPYYIKEKDGSYSGSEADQIKLVFERISAVYRTPIEIEFVVLEGDSYFEPLVAGLDDRKVDVVFARTAVVAERQQSVDYTCSSSTAKYVLVAGPDAVGEKRAHGNDVGCVGSTFFCTLPLPDGLEFDKSFTGTSDILAAVANGDIGYGVVSADEANSFECDGCSVTDIELGSNVVAPFTRRLDNPTTPSAIFAVAKAHATQLAHAIDEADWRGQKAVKSALKQERRAAERRYSHLCDNVLQDDECEDAVGQAFDN